jgi:hypothetical protein
MSMSYRIIFINKIMFLYCIRGYVTIAYRLYHIISKFILMHDHDVQGRFKARDGKHAE